MANVDEILPKFNGQVNVTHRKNEKGEGWLTTPREYGAERDSVGADTIDVSEDGKRFRFFDEDGVCVGDYRLCHTLEGKTPAELATMKTCLLFFKSWYPAESRWVNWVAKGTPKTKSKNAVKA